MEPKRFKESNITFTRPANMPNVGDLPAYRNRKQIISCWKASFADRLRILFTGNVWIGIMGQVQPPIWVEGKVPFYRATLKDNMKYWISEIVEHSAEKDKMYHLLCGEVIAVIVAALGDYWFDTVAAVLAGIAAGFAKDYIWDKWLKKGTFDYLDIVFTGLGSVVGAAVYAIVKLLLG